MEGSDLFSGIDTINLKIMRLFAQPHNFWSNLIIALR